MGSIYTGQLSGWSKSDRHWLIQAGRSGVDPQWKQAAWVPRSWLRGHQRRLLMRPHPKEHRPCILAQLGSRETESFPTSCFPIILKKELAPLLAEQ